jgi:hypothetical protein
MLEECRLRPPRSAVNSARIGLLLFVPFKGQKIISKQSAATPMRMPTKRSRPGVQRLGGISRAGDERLRQLLVLEATAVIQYTKPGRPATSPWLLNLLSPKPRKLGGVGCGAGTACAIPGRTTAWVARRIGHFGGTDALAEAACDALRLIGARRALRAAASGPASRVRFPKPVATGAERIP